MIMNVHSTSREFVNLLLPALTNIFTVMAILFRETSCERFHCSSDIFFSRTVDPYLRQSPTFNSPCSCLPDWNSMFCNQTQVLSSHSRRIAPELPTVCICRKFVDSGSKCQQFITRCFNRENKKCTCCFNQPNDYCDHLSCKDGEPEFSSSNTSCVCHHSPADYPYYICKPSLLKNDSPDHLEAAKARQDSIFNEERSQNHFSFNGFFVPSSIATFFLIGLLLGVILLMAIILYSGKRKRQKRREDNLSRRQNAAAHEALLMQQADDDRYLPSV